MENRFEDIPIEVHIERLQQVYIEAAKSPDSRTQVGALLFDCVDNFLGADHNRPIIEMDIVLQLDRYIKKFVNEHAERNVVRNAIKKYGYQAVCGSTLYTNGMLCCDCAREIRDFGVARIIYDERNDALTDDKWITMFDWSENQLTHLDPKLRPVEIIRINRNFSHVPILYDGDIIER